MQKKTTDLKPGDKILHEGRFPDIVVRVEIEPLPCVVAKIYTSNPASWFYSGINAIHEVSPANPNHGFPFN